MPFQRAKWKAPVNIRVYFSSFKQKDKFVQGKQLARAEDTNNNNHQTLVSKLILFFGFIFFSLAGWKPPQITFWILKCVVARWRVSQLFCGRKKENILPPTYSSRARLHLVVPSSVYVSMPSNVNRANKDIAGEMRNHFFPIVVERKKRGKDWKLREL